MTLRPCSKEGREPRIEGGPGNFISLNPILLPRRHSEALQKVHILWYSVIRSVSRLVPFGVRWRWGDTWQGGKGVESHSEQEFPLSHWEPLFVHSLRTTSTLFLRVFKKFNPNARLAKQPCCRIWSNKSPTSVCPILAQNCPMLSHLTTPTGASISCSLTNIGQVWSLFSISPESKAGRWKPLRFQKGLLKSAPPDLTIQCIPSSTELDQ